MDGTQDKSSNAIAAATRKRRSSILKNQRPPRTPFSELEFNVATPTDTAKSRRVSFSRRTGVAEFITNEATTAWKSVYEEQNKSLELSNNDSGVNKNQLQTIGHIGRRIFDQQFQDEEADIEYLEISGPPGRKTDVLCNNINITQQIASLEPLGDETDMLDKFCVNTSTAHQLDTEDLDDLDEIQKDIQRGSNAMCQGPFRERINGSQYFEVDLNMTHVTMGNENYDMSITETIHSLKEQEVLNNFTKYDKTFNKDLVADKENVLLNPYIAPKETDNFAINEKSDEVLVFDGKKLIIQSETSDILGDNIRKTILPVAVSDEAPSRKHIVINVNDDLPNFLDDVHVTNTASTSTLVDINNTNKTTWYTESDINLNNQNSSNLSITKALSGNFLVSTDMNEKRKTILYETNAGNISITQALASNILTTKTYNENKNSVCYEDDMAVTQAIEANIILTHPTLRSENNAENRKTILFNDDIGHISVTQSAPSNLILTSQNNTVSEKRKTIVFDDDAGDVSITQAIPNNIVISEKSQVSSEKRRTTLFDDNLADVSVTKALPTNIILPGKDRSNKRMTIVYEGDKANISVTQAVPNIILTGKKEAFNEEQKTMVYGDTMGDISMTRGITSSIILGEQSNKNRTLVCENNKTVDEALPTNIGLPGKCDGTNKRRTIVYEDDKADISVTQAVPNVILIKEIVENKEQKTVVYEDTMGDISITRGVPTNIILPGKDRSNKRMTIVYEGDKANISVTQAVPNIILTGKKEAINEEQKTMVYGDTVGDISMTHGITTSIILGEQSNKNRTFLCENSIKHVPVDVQSHIDDQKKEENHKFENSKIALEGKLIDVSMTQAIPSEIITCGRPGEEVNRNNVKCGKTKTNALDNDVSEISVTQAVPNNIILHVPEDQTQQTLTNQHANFSITRVAANQNNGRLNNEIRSVADDGTKYHMTGAPIDNGDINTLQAKRKTILFDDNLGELSMTRPIVTNMLDVRHEILNKSNDTLNINSSNGMFCDIRKQRVAVYQADVTHNTPKVLSNRTEQGDLKTEANISNPSVDKVDTKLSQENNKSIKDIIKKDSETNSDNSVLQKVSDNVPQEIRSNDSEPINSPKETVSKSEITSNISVIQEKSKKSLLNDLLDMSDGIEDKGLMAKVDSVPSSDLESLKLHINNPSKDSYFYITRDNDDDAQTDKELNIEETNIQPNTEQVETLKYADGMSEAKSPLSLEYKQSDEEIENDEQEKLVKLKKGDNSLYSRQYEKVSSSDLDNAVKDEQAVDKTCNNEQFSKTKSFRDVDNTKDLLDILSDLTDGYKTQDIKVDDEKPMEPIKYNNRIAIEDKTANEPKRLSFAPSRQSIVLSTEDLYNNISMAQAMLQKSRLEIDETINDDDDIEIESPVVQDLPQKKHFPVNNEIVKTLRFDESASEISIKSEIKVSPLRKTVFGETSYMKEDKAKVIPSYLKDVSDDIKVLMSDLVKPMADFLPYESACVDKDLNRTPSTRSTQIQANLLTSSQIDLDFDTMSEAESLKGVLKSKTKPISVEPSDISFKTHQYKSQPISKQTVPGRVLVFDHTNPLNNVLLTPADVMEAHKYDPVKSTETICGSDRSDSVQISLKETADDEIDAGRVTHVGNVIINTMQQAGDSCAQNAAENQDLMSIPSKQLSIDQSIETQQTNLKDTEINTDIAMKGNKELLDASSSLTLVDDALTHQVFDVDIDSQVESSQPSEKDLEIKKSPVRVIYKINENSTVLEKIDSDFTSNDDESSPPVCDKPKKRNYSPTKAVEDKDGTLSRLDLTPKPKSKVRKLSDSPNSNIQNDKVQNSPEMETDKDVPKPIIKTEQISQHSSFKKSPNAESSPEKRMKSPRKPKTSPKSKKPGTIVTIQQVTTDYHLDPTVDQGTNEPDRILGLRGEKSDVSTITINPRSESRSDASEMQSPEAVSSFTSSKHNNAHVTFSASTTEFHTLSCSDRSRSRSDWQPALVQENSSKNLAVECESSANVVSKIDMLSFMGSECEWECTGGDVWTFLLMRARVRVRVRFAHRHRNALRSCVRADTPIVHAAVDATYGDKRNSVAVLCVKFATEAMRYYLGRGVGTAGEVPSFLKRCVGIARLAVRWGRAMYDAKMQLAYTLTEDGLFALKVANVPMRSVWEVSMRVDMVVDDASDSPSPRAGHVRVTPVVADYDVTEHEVRCALGHVKHDWGHMPRTVWRIFKHLKNKTREDDVFLGL